MSAGCKACGGDVYRYTPKRTYGRRRQFCSGVCRQNWFRDRARVAPYARQCIQCSKEFLSVFPVSRHHFCSSDCRLAYNKAESRRKYWADGHPRVVHKKKSAPPPGLGPHPLDGAFEAHVRAHGRRLCSVCSGPVAVKNHKYCSAECKKIGLKRRGKSGTVAAYERRGENNKRRRTEKCKAYYLTWKAKGCSVCGEKFPQAIDAHHLDPKAKTGQVGRLISSGSLKRLASELRGCIPLCATCHRKVTWGAMDHNGKVPDACGRVDHTYITNEEGGTTAVPDFMVKPLQQPLFGWDEEEGKWPEDYAR